MKTSPLKSIVNLCIVVVIAGSLFELAKKHNYNVDNFKRSLTQFADSYDKEHKLGKYGELKDVKTKSSDNTESEVNAEPETKNSKNVVYVHGLGDYNQEDLEIISQGIEDFYGFEVEIGNPHSNPSSRYFINGEYVNAFEVLKLEEQDGDGRHVYVTNHPLCANEIKTELISGYAMYYHEASVVSTYQLKQNGNYRISNLQNVANHELGHNFGLNHCDDEDCLMKVNGTNRKEFCNNCKRKLNQ